MRIPESPPKIGPAPDGERPLWSVMIPVYNCSPYLPELLRSVLPQAMSEAEMQIEVVDDCSTDADVEKIVSEIGNGRIGYYRQSENVGSLRNFESCINRSTGHYIHLLHGDDKLLPGFYEQMTNVFKQFPEVGAALCAHEQIDSKGNLTSMTLVKDGSPFIYENWLEVEAAWQRTQYVAMVVKRSVYEDVGGFYGVTYGEDWEMWARIARRYKVAYIPKILAQYREHDLSISGNSYATGKNLQDIAKVINTIGTYLPEDRRKALKKAASKNYAYYALNRKYAFWKRNRGYAPGVAFFIAVLKMHTDAKLLGKMMKVILRVTMYKVGTKISYNSLKRGRIWKFIRSR